MKAKRITTTNYKFNQKHGGFQPTSMTVMVTDEVETVRETPKKPRGGVEEVEGE